MVGGATPLGMLRSMRLCSHKETVKLGKPHAPDLAPGRTSAQALLEYQGVGKPAKTWFHWILTWASLGRWQGSPLTHFHGLSLGTGGLGG